MQNEKNYIYPGEVLLNLQCFFFYGKLERQSFQSFRHSNNCMTVVNKKDFEFNLCLHQLTNINVNENYMGIPMGCETPDQVKSICRKNN